MKHSQQDLPITITERYHAALDRSHDERRAAQDVLTQLDAPACARLRAQAQAATFTRRRYGPTFYAWLHHPLVQKPIDPWPASHWPHDVLDVTIEMAREAKAAGPTTSTSVDVLLLTGSPHDPTRVPDVVAPQETATPQW